MQPRPPVPFSQATPAVAGVFHLVTVEPLPPGRGLLNNRTWARLALSQAQHKLSTYERRHPAPRTHFERRRCAELAGEVARCQVRLHLAKRFHHS